MSATDHPLALVLKLEVNGERGLQALYFLTGVKGTAELESVEPEKSRVRIALAWTP